MVVGHGHPTQRMYLNSRSARDRFIVIAFVCFFLSFIGVTFPLYDFKFKRYHFNASQYKRYNNVDYFPAYRPIYRMRRPYIRYRHIYCLLAHSGVQSGIGYVLNGLHNLRRAQWHRLNGDVIDSEGRMHSGRLPAKRARPERT